MRIGMISSGNMGIHLVRKLLQGDHECVVFNSSPAVVETLAEENALITFSLEKFIQQLPQPRIIWMMVPANGVEELLVNLIPHLNADDIVVDGGSSYYMDDIERAKILGKKGIHYLDCCAFGGELGLVYGYRLLIGGDQNVVNKLTDIFKTLTHDVNAESKEPDESVHFADGTHSGYLYCGPNGAGHFVKMIRNGIEYGLMAVYTERMKDLKGGKFRPREPSVVHQNATYSLLDLRAIAKVWSRGSEYLDLMAVALLKESELSVFNLPPREIGRASTGCHTTKSNPANRNLKRNWRFGSNNSNYDQPAMSREEAEFTDKMLSMMCFEFNGNEEARSQNNALQRLLKHCYQKVCTDYQSVMNQ